MVIEINHFFVISYFCILKLKRSACNLYTFKGKWTPWAEIAKEQCHNLCSVIYIMVSIPEVTSRLVQSHVFKTMSCCMVCTCWQHCKIFWRVHFSDSMSLIQYFTIVLRSFYIISHWVGLGWVVVFFHIDVYSWCSLCLQLLKTFDAPFSHNYFLNIHFKHLFFQICHLKRTVA